MSREIIRIEIWDIRHGGLQEATKTADVFNRCLDRAKAVGLKDNRCETMNADIASPRLGN